MFGGQQSGKPLPKGKKTPAELKAEALARQRKLMAADESIEGSLKLVLDDPALQELSRKVLLEDEAAESDAPLIKLVNSLLVEAVKRGASDIHVEPFEQMLRVRFRVDGVLQEVQKIPQKLTSAIASRLKIMADLDICEKRIPQDGSIHFKSGDIEADFRMSSLPSVFGEKIVMRVVGATNTNNDLSKLGMPDAQLKLFREAINKPDGLVLVTGPTGSGKTTTLYAALNELNDLTVSVFTAEDPVEGTLPGVTQCQVNSHVGFTFASILRSLLRQDPDVILVGEIRDQETADIAIKAALTGHLVLSTLHTNCAVSTISRLLDMGIAPYLLTSSINCVVAQRLVRKVCFECKKQIPLPPEILETLGTGKDILNGHMVWHGEGCKTCGNTGYKGRAPIYEMLTLTDELRRLILDGAPKEELKNLARLQGMMTLREAGFHLIKEGITTLEEVLGITNEDPTVKLKTGPTIAAPAASQPDLNLTGDIGSSAQVASTDILEVSDDKLKLSASRWKLGKPQGPEVQ